jgi:uncharacterized protein YkwD
VAPANERTSFDSRLPSTSTKLDRMRRLLVTVALLLAVFTGCNPVQEQYALQAINAFRATAGAPALVRSAELDRAAAWQVARMAHLGQLQHSRDLATGLAPGWTILGENIAAGPSVEAVVLALEQSAPHRLNLLEVRFKRIGVAVITRGSTVYIVELFAG